MASQTIEFYFDDPAGLGRKFRVRTDDPNATREQAAEFLNSLTDEELEAYVVRDDTKKAPTGPRTTPSQNKQTQQTIPNTQPDSQQRLPSVWDTLPTPEVYTNTEKPIPQWEALYQDLLDAFWSKGKRSPEELTKILEKHGLSGWRFTQEELNKKVPAILKYYKRTGQIPQTFKTITVPTGEEAPKAPDTIFEQAAEAAKRSALSMGNALIGAGALAADLVGADQTAQDLLDTYLEKQAAIDYYYGNTKGLDDIKDVGSFGMYLADTLGEFAPQLAASLGFGALGKAAGELAVRRAVREMVEDRVAAGIPREIAEKEAADLIRKRATQGAVAGTFAHTSTQEAGANYGNTYIKTGEKAPISSLIAGIASGSLDAILPLRTLNKLGGQVAVDEFKKGLLRRMAEEGVKDFFIEGGTEALQEFISTLPETVVTGKSPLNAETLNQMIEAFFKGATAGATVGAGTAALSTPIALGRTPELSGKAALPKGLIEPPSTTDRKTAEYKQQIQKATEQVQSFVSEITKTWTNAPTEVKALPNFEGEEGVDNSAVGVYTSDGRVLINTEQVIELAKRRRLTPEEITRAVIFHEALGHHGLTQQFGEQLDDMLDVIYTKGSESFRNMVDSWLIKNPDAYADLDPEQRRIRATEEVLAEMSENEGLIPPSLINALIDLIKRFAREVGVALNIETLQNIKYTPREIRGILGASQRQVLVGDPTGATPGMVKNLIVYHGGHPFEPTPNNPLGEFDFSKIGTGQGFQSYGWGIYLTDLRDIAEFFRRTYGGGKKTTWRGIDLKDDYHTRQLIKDSVLREFVNDSQLSRDQIESFVDAAIAKRLEYDRRAWYKPIEDPLLIMDPNDYFKNYSFHQQIDLKRILNYIEKNYKMEYVGKVYEVELPDDALWLEWEVPLSEQPRAMEALKNGGFEIISKEESKKLNRELDKLENKADALIKAAKNKNLSEKKRDDAFDKFVETQDKIRSLKKIIRNSVAKDWTGGEVYTHLASSWVFGSKKEASLKLKDLGFLGNRYLADNLYKKRPRKNDGTDTFNYVVFDEKVPKIINRYMRGAEQTDDGEESFRAKPGVNARRMARMLGPQLYGNPKNMGAVTVKEIFQNSVDAVRSAIRNGMIEQGRIDIIVSPDGRTVTMLDNGIGMPPEVLGGKFLEIAGTGKEGNKNSGGFGIAKMLFLYANKSIEVVTANNGRVSTLKTTGQQLFDSLEDPNSAPNISVRPLTDKDFDTFPEGHGTKITLTIPKEAEMPDGTKQEIEPIETYYTLHPSIYRSPLFSNIEVRMTKEGNTYFHTVPVGSHFEIENYKPLASVKLPWGSAKIYVLRDPLPGKIYEANIHFLSNGLWQFSGHLPKDPDKPHGENVPYIFYVDIIPSVKPDEPGYPFAFNRQGFNKDAEEDFSKVRRYLNALYSFKSYQESSKNFGTISYIDPETLQIGPPIELVAELPEVNRDITGTISEGSVIGINEEGVMTVDGQVVPDLSVEELRKAIPKVDSLKVPEGTVDPTRPLIHDNTIIGPRNNLDEYQSITDYMLDKFGDRFIAFLSEIGETFKTLRDEVAKLLNYPDLLKEGVGISLDPTYRGVSIRLPFSASLVNPLWPESEHPFEQGYGIWGTMLHELAHHKIRHHGDNFAIEMQKIWYTLKGRGQNIDEMERNFARRLANLYADIIKEGRTLYEWPYNSPYANSEIYVRTRRTSFDEREERASPTYGSEGSPEGLAAASQGPTGVSGVFGGYGDSSYSLGERELDRQDLGKAPGALVKPNRYMRGDGPIDPDELTADDILAAEDAMKILKRAAEAYQPKVFSPEAVLQNLLTRGVDPVAIAKLNAINPTQVVKRLYQYDIAAQKLTEKILDLEEEARTKPLTPEKQAEFLVATLTQDEIFKNAFMLQAEVGRSLNALKKAVYTRRSTEQVRRILNEFLAENDLEALNDPETFLKFMKNTADALRNSPNNPNAKPTFGQRVISFLGVPRSIMSAMDLSAPMRQGLPFFLRPQYWKSFVKMFSKLGPSGGDNYAALMRLIASDPNYPYMLQARIAFSDLDGGLSAREEGFQSELANKIPGIRMSNQAYAGFLNKLRADMFNKYFDYYKRIGADVTDPKLLRSLGDFINTATGRAELGEPFGVNLNAAGPLLNLVFFSARLIKSRFNMLNPFWYWRLHPRVRLAALRTLGETVLSIAGLITLTYGVLSAFGYEPEIELDPRSAAFGEIRVGDIRIDLGGGFNEFVTFGVRTAAWASGAVAEWLGFDPEWADEKTRGGKYVNYGGKGRYDKTYWDEFVRFFRNKLAPIPSYLVAAAEGSEPTGEPFDPAGSLASRLMPMSINAIWDTAKYEGGGAAAVTAIPSIFGIDIATYPDKDRDPTQKLTGPNSVIRRQLEPGIYEYFRVDEDGTVTFNSKGKKLYDATYNNYFQALIRAYTIDTGRTWKELPPETQRQIIADAKALAEIYTKEDMEVEMGLPIRSEQVDDEKEYEEE